ncbi:MAG TPA: hypothetical protein VNO43_06395 [Candidatus Eisenbacteria bacterium]|nr:hypothetical protein [Candidatus Eisenbacteria bacterium]
MNTGWGPVIALFVALLGYAGCAASNTRLVAQWQNPVYTAGSFENVMIAAVGPDLTSRRSFEDEFVSRLGALGVSAFPSYRVLPQEQADETGLKEAARRAGSTAVILGRSVDVEQKTELGPRYYPTPSFGVFGRNMGAVWHGMYGAPSVRRYNEYTSEIKLVDVAKDQVVWSGTFKTNEAENINAAIRDYVETVINVLKEKNLLRSSH